MKIYKEIKQGSELWKEIRWGKIGGSTAGKLMTKLDKPVTDVAEFNTVLSEQMEDFDPFAPEKYVSQAMERGIRLEPEARDEFMRITGQHVAEYGWIELDDNFVGISPDGWNVSEKIACEIKCPEGSTHVSYLRDNMEFVRDYAFQIVHYFLVLEIDTLYCISFRPENKFVPTIIFPVTLDTRVQITAKLNYSIAELVEIQRKRLNEVKSAVKKEIELQTIVNIF